MEPPEQIDPQGGADYLEVLTKAAFQAGVSWAVVESKWDGFRGAFKGFDPEAVAGFDEGDIDELAQDASIIRNRRKIAATVENARTIVDLEDEHGDFATYLRSQGNFEATSADVQKRFKFIGDFGAFYFLYVVGEPVPEYNDWRRSRGLEPVDH